MISKKWKIDVLYSFGVLFYNNGVDVLWKVIFLVSLNKEKYVFEKVKVDVVFKKVVDYLGEVVILLFNRIEIK